MPLPPPVTRVFMPLTSVRFLIAFTLQVIL